MLSLMMRFFGFQFTMLDSFDSFGFKFYAFYLFY